MINIVIFGGTGNLTIKKLIPAILKIYNGKSIGERIRVYAISRRDYSKEQYIEFLVDGIKKLTDISDEIPKEFLSTINYFSLNFADDNGFLELIKHLNSESKNIEEKSNFLIYFATSPEYFKIISENLKKYPLDLKKDSWKRLIIEKPFGRDLKTAIEVNKSLTLAFASDEIFRIDHYLGKEMIQNIISTRFSNRIFEDIWNGNSIESIQIVVSENTGIENRGAYYDQSGAFRDMIQSHLLQMLAIVAMDTPETFNAEHITEEKLKVLKSLDAFSKKSIEENLIIGQYKGYLEEKGVANNSTTETYVAMKCKLNIKKWRDVPFYLKTGKYLAKKKAHIVIQFKQNSNLNKLWESSNEAKNLLVFKIQPEEGIYFKINVKRAGLDKNLDQVSIDYCHSCNKIGNHIDAYERLLINAIKNDKTLFASWEEIKACWDFIDKLTCDCIDRENKLVYYDKGIRCLEESRKLLTEDKWWMN